MFSQIVGVGGGDNWLINWLINYILPINPTMGGSLLNRKYKSPKDSGNEPNDPKQPWQMKFAGTPIEGYPASLHTNL
jgi:hypothetical protein